MSRSIFPTQYLTNVHGHRLAYSETGAAQASCLILCLPGLLETRASFDSLLAEVKAMPNLRAISLDYVGRGDSDALSDPRQYVMSRYLQDANYVLSHFVEHDKNLSIVLAGTSMGGILSMYLARDWGDRVKNVLLNDVGLSLNWVSIYGLYGQMRKSGSLKDLHQLALQLNVREEVIQAVQLPTHFDLPYKKDWRGMHFGALLQNFKGEISLVRGMDSVVCLPAQIQELKRLFLAAHVLEIPAQGHPVAFTQEVVSFLLADIDLMPASKNATDVDVIHDHSSATPLRQTNALDDPPRSPVQMGWLQRWRSKFWPR
jgi:pimeloyl-ACP methyl ester carboxylesterase